MPERGVFALQIGTSNFSAEFPTKAGASSNALPEVGDLAKVIGVARIQLDREKRGFDIRLELGNPENIKLLAKRPMMERVAWGRVSLAAILLACGAFFWVSALGNRVRARTHQLEEANRQAEQARAQAERASRVKGEFLANMSHEIRTPMNGILGMTESALETPLSTEQRELIETAHFSAESLLTIVNDILDFSKIEAGKLQLDFIPFSLRKMLTKRLKAHNTQAVRKGLKLSYEIQESVPDTIVSDPTRVSQIITNLIGNALKFTTFGEIEGKLRLDDIVNQTARLHFSVRDTGIGIPLGKQQSIFEAF
jgi:signal transduction histidine kinase